METFSHDEALRKLATNGRVNMARQVIALGKILCRICLVIDI